MNHFTLQCTVASTSELRHTANDQKPIVEFYVEFVSGKDDELTERLRCTVWGDKAPDVAANLQQGQMIVLEGSLNISQVERPEGHKDKVPTLNVSRWHIIDAAKAAPTASQSARQKTAATQSKKPAAQAATQSAADDFDDIPF